MSAPSTSGLSVELPLRRDYMSVFEIYVILKFRTTYQFLWGHELANSFLLLIHQHVLLDANTPAPQPDTCNCKKKPECPLEGIAFKLA